MQSLALEKEHYKKLNSILYKFIWNRHYMAAKAPERIKREIVNKPIKLGGLGMLDVVSLDEGIKIKALGRLLVTKHPYMSLIKAGLNLSNFFDPVDTLRIDKLARKGVELLGSDRNKLWQQESLSTHRNLLNCIGDLDLRTVVNDRGRNSIPFYLKWRAGARTVKDLTVQGLRDLNRYIEPSRISKLETAIRTRAGTVDEVFLESYFISNIARPLHSVSSKQIRESRSQAQVIKEFKIGMQLTNTEGLSWGLKLSKVTSVKLRNIILRVAHGDIYTEEKLHRFGLIDSPICPRCNEIEDLKHKFVDCDYIQRIWKHVLESVKSITTIDPQSLPQVKAILGGYLESNPVILTINAEIMQRIQVLKDNQDHLIHPRHFARNALQLLVRRENNRESKEKLKSVLEILERA